MMRLYHNNKKVVETEKAGRKGQKFIVEVEAYLNKVLSESSESDVHIFKIEGKSFTHIFTIVYNPKSARWNYKTVANF